MTDELHTTNFFFLPDLRFIIRFYSQHQIGKSQDSLINCRLSSLRRNTAAMPFRIPLSRQNQEARSRQVPTGDIVMGIQIVLQLVPILIEAANRRRCLHDRNTAPKAMGLVPCPYVRHLRP